MTRRAYRIRYARDKAVLEGLALSQLLNKMADAWDKALITERIEGFNLQIVEKAFKSPYFTLVPKYLHVKERLEYFHEDLEFIFESIEEAKIALEELVLRLETWADAIGVTQKILLDAIKQITKISNKASRGRVTLTEGYEQEVGAPLVRLIRMVNMAIDEGFMNNAIAEKINALIDTVTGNLESAHMDIRLWLDFPVFLQQQASLISIET